MKEKKPVVIIVLIVLSLSMWSAGVLAMEYPIITGPVNTLGQKIETLINSSSPTIEMTGYKITQPSYVQAQPSSCSVVINGLKEPFEAYEIDGRTYFRLRDLAMALNGSEKRFDVTWDGTKSAINILTDKPYVVSGGELTLVSNPVNKNATLSTANVYIDGEEASLSAYEIEGRTYFKLRDLASALNFAISWEGSTNTVRIDPVSNYVSE